MIVKGCPSGLLSWLVTSQGRTGRVVRARVDWLGGHRSSILGTWCLQDGRLYCQAHHLSNSRSCSDFGPLVGPAGGKAGHCVLTFPQQAPGRVRPGRPQSRRVNCGAGVLGSSSRKADARTGPRVANLER